MPHILIVSATAQEIQPTLDKYAVIVTGDGLVDVYLNEKDHLSILITGVGMVNTAFAMGRYCSLPYAAIINVGICGTFKNSIHLGEVVHVVQDELSEMGAENDTEFIKYHQLKLGGTNAYQNNWLIHSKTIHALKTVRGITVNTVHGNEESITQVKKLFTPDVESMEGAAFFSGCRRLDNYTQIRAVSNYVEKRNKDNWKTTLAIDNLNKTLQTVLEELFAMD